MGTTMLSETDVPELDNFVGGVWRPVVDAERVDDVDPASGAVLDAPPSRRGELRDAVLHGRCNDEGPLRARADPGPSRLERDGILENVRGHESYLPERVEALMDLPIVDDVRGAGFFWALELVKDEAATPFDAGERERLLRGFLPERLLEAGLIARADDRGDSVLQITPPLISDEALLGEIVDGLRGVLADAGQYMNVRAPVAS